MLELHINQMITECVYQSNQCLSPLTIESHSWGGVPDTILCDQVCQYLAADRWFLYVSFINENLTKTIYNVTGILLKVASNTITITPELYKTSLKIQKMLYFKLFIIPIESCYYFIDIVRTSVHITLL
jgi:hypothetical protein